MKILDRPPGARIPHRFMQPDGVARTIAELCHPAIYWPTRNVLHVDGVEN